MYPISTRNVCVNGKMVPVGMQASLAGGRVSGTTDSSQDWETLLPNSRNTVNVGGILSGSVNTLSPVSVLINGVQCTLTTKAGR